MAHVCESCARTVSLDKKIIDHLSVIMFFMWDLREQHLEVFEWESKSHTDVSVWAQIGLTGDTDTHFVNFENERTSYSVYHMARNKKWIAYKNTAKSSQFKCV